MSTQITAQDSLERLFPWLTRTGMGRKFGSMPIGWYQMHQCAALDVLTEHLKSAGLPVNAPLRVKQGNVQARTETDGWRTLVSTITVFQAADNRARK